MAREEVEMKHRIKWFVYAVSWDRSRVERLPHVASMRGSWDGWDAECSCGWASRTGGAIKARVSEAVADHKWDVANGFWRES
jgi:hypothetical protein